MQNKLTIIFAMGDGMKFLRLYFAGVAALMSLLILLNHAT